MDPGFPVLTQAEIRNWLRQLIVPGETKISTRPTLDSVGTYCGIPRNTMKWLALKDTANMSPERQRLLSKVIALVDNGLLEWEIRGQEKVAVLRDKPRPRVRYGFSMQPGGPRLTYIDRPSPPRGLRGLGTKRP